MADLQVAGISSVSSEVLHILARGGESAVLHFFKRIAGNPSGPGAALDAKSFMASASSVSLKLISLRLGCSVGSWLANSVFKQMSSFGELNTELYCSLRISAMSLGSLISCFVLLIRGPTPTLIFEYLFANVKKNLGFILILSIALDSVCCFCSEWDFWSSFSM